MSYNTRRSTGAAPNTVPSSANVGQRRPAPMAQALGNSFVPGGQLSQTSKPPAQQQQGGQQTNQQQKPAGFQQQKPQQQTNVQQQLNTQQQQQRQQQVAAQQQKPMQQVAQQMLNQQQQQQPKILFKEEPRPDASLTGIASSTENANGSTNGDAGTTDVKRKPFWMRKEGKISKKERLRRRNQRLRKILQPKNALMVLNEMVGSAQYNVNESGDPHSGPLFRCSVMVDGIQYMGYGRSKPAAKTSAAECAIKNMVLSKLKISSLLHPQPEAGATVTDASAAGIDEPMITNLEEETEDTIAGLSWSHIASYALHKLLSSWGEDNLPEKVAQLATGNPPVAANVTPPTPPEKKPAKKMPDNAAAMNPIMLLNQMHPNAVYEEVSKTGVGPKFIFTIKCTVGDKFFMGTGNSKKVARKSCAFAACRELLGVEYPPEALEELNEAPADMQVG